MCAFFLYIAADVVDGRKLYLILLFFWGRTIEVMVFARAPLEAADINLCLIYLGVLDCRLQTEYSQSDD